MAYLKNHHDIEDVFHNTIIKVYEKIDQLREERYFESWVTSIFLNECKAVCRKNKPRRVEDVSTQKGDLNMKQS
ncbi:RNA polymerase sigma factor [Caldalkalibacillus mannanilyticus]|uniref:RNA polymerase sigma factor n=1 Tax=Caldalkalibacillus mannanilyticus TaxID=1418 RepID=UPI0006873554